MTAVQKRVLVGIVIAVVVLAAFALGFVIADDDESGVDATGSDQSTSTTTPTTEATPTTSPDTTPPPVDLPRPVVIVDGTILGWWDGATWQSAVTEGDEDLPPAPVDARVAYEFVDLDGASSTSTLGSVDIGCYLENNYAVQAQDARGAIGLPVGYDLLPRAPQGIAASAAHEESVREWLAAKGIDDPDVSIDRVTRVDIEGDGRDEVFIEASSLSNPSLLDEEEGDYSVLLMRYVDDADQVFTVEIDGDVVDAERANSEEFGGYIATVSVIGFGDLDQDGDLELATRSGYYEGESIQLVDIDGDTSMTVLTTGCGA